MGTAAWRPSGRPAYQVAKMGLGFVPEERRIFPDLTVRQNLEVAVKNAATPHGKAWTVEAAIPLNELSAPASSPILVRIERIRAMRPGIPRERWHWLRQWRWRWGWPDLSAYRYGR